MRETVSTHVHNPTTCCSCHIEHHAGGRESIVYCRTHTKALEMAAMLQDWPVQMSADEWNMWHRKRLALLREIEEDHDEPA